LIALLVAYSLSWARFCVSGVDGMIEMKMVVVKTVENGKENLYKGYKATAK
jgi:hypothetical protein